MANHVVGFQAERRGGLTRSHRDGDDDRVLPLGGAGRVRPRARLSGSEVRRRRRAPFALDPECRSIASIESYPAVVPHVLPLQLAIELCPCHALGAEQSLVQDERSRPRPPRRSPARGSRARRACWTVSASSGAPSASATSRATGHAAARKPDHDRLFVGQRRHERCESAARVSAVLEHRCQSAITSATVAFVIRTRSAAARSSESECDPASTVTDSRSATRRSTTTRSPSGPPNGGTAPSSNAGYAAATLPPSRT